MLLLKNPNHLQCAFANQRKALISRSLLIQEDFKVQILKQNCLLQYRSLGHKKHSWDEKPLIWIRLNTNCHFSSQSLLQRFYTFSVLFCRYECKSVSVSLLPINTLCHSNRHISWKNSVFTKNCSNQGHGIFTWTDFQVLSISWEKACNILGWKINLLQTSSSEAPNSHDKVLKRINCFSPYNVFPSFYFPSDTPSNS